MRWKPKALPLGWVIFGFQPKNVFTAGMLIENEYFLRLAHQINCCLYFSSKTPSKTSSSTKQEQQTKLTNN
jgi:hypothetical protein